MDEFCAVEHFVLGEPFSGRVVDRRELALVDIRTLDHLIVAGADTLSFAERGLL
jgi:hypothetical protein